MMSQSFLEFSFVAYTVFRMMQMVFIYDTNNNILLCDAGCSRRRRRVVIEGRSVTPEWPRVVDLLHRSAGCSESLLLTENVVFMSTVFCWRRKELDIIGTYLK